MAIETFERLKGLQSLTMLCQKDYILFHENGNIAANRRIRGVLIQLRKSAKEVQEIVLAEARIIEANKKEAKRK